MLLQANDTLTGIAQLDGESMAQWQDDNEQHITDLAEAISQASQGNMPEGSAQTTPTQNKQATPDTETDKHEENTEKEQNNPQRLLRLSTERLDHLMELAGEVQLSAEQMQPIYQHLANTHKRMLKLKETFQQLRSRTSTQQLDQGLNETEQELDHCNHLLNHTLEELSQHERQSSSVAQRLSYEVLDSRMQKFDDAIPAFKRSVRDISQTLGKLVRLEVSGLQTDIDRDVMERMQAPMQHILRNALDHGIETPAERLQKGKPEEGVIHIEARHFGGMLLIRIQDDGRGIDPEGLRQKIVQRGLSTESLVAQMNHLELMDFLLLPQFSMKDEVSELSGRGVGLDLVANCIKELRGQIHIHSEVEKGCQFDISLPLTLSTVRSLLIEINHEMYAIPLTRIDFIQSISAEDITHAEGRQYIHLRERHIGLVTASQLFEIPNQKQNGDVHIVVFEHQQKHYGLVVDKLLNENNLIEKPLDPTLGKLRNISSGAIDSKGHAILIIDVDDLLLSMQNLIQGGHLRQIESGEQELLSERKHILVVEDSITVREAERRMLENQGYQVTMAVDGMDGWNALRSGQFDLVMTDIDMPRMNGIELLRMIRAEYRQSDIPVMIVSYKDRQEDRMAGLDAGADYYLTKSSFHDNTMLEGVQDLIGQAHHDDAIKT